MSESPYHLILSDMSGALFDATPLVQAYIEGAATYIAKINDPSVPESRVSEERVESFGFHVGMVTAVKAICGQQGLEIFEAHLDRIDKTIRIDPLQRNFNA